MRLRTSHAAKSGVGEHTARESECAQRMRWERARGERPPPNLAPEPKGSGALFFCTSGTPLSAVNIPGAGPEPGQGPRLIGRIGAPERR
jgi:hypothetical protein